MDLRRPRLRRELASASIIALLVLGTSASASGRSSDEPACTHGASSIGPVALKDGRIVGGDLTPHTEACLP